MEKSVAIGFAFEIAFDPLFTRGADSYFGARRRRTTRQVDARCEHGWAERIGVALTGRRHVPLCIRYFDEDRHRRVAHSGEFQACLEEYTELHEPWIDDSQRVRARQEIRNLKCAAGVGDRTVWRSNQLNDRTARILRRQA